MAKDPAKDRKKAQQEFAQINIRIRAWEKEVRKWDGKNPVKWHDATSQVKVLKEKRQQILRRMGS